MDDNELIYESLGSQEVVENKTRSYLSTDDGLNTFKRFFGCKKFTIGYIFAWLAFLAIDVIILSFNIKTILNHGDYDTFLSLFTFYNVFGLVLLLLIAIIFFIVYVRILKELSKINPFFADAYKRYKRSVALGIASSVVGGAANSSHSAIGKSVGNIASAGLDVASTYNGYKATFNLIYGIMHELSKENAKSEAINKGEKYIQKYRGFIIISVVSIILLTLIEACLAISGYAVDNPFPILIVLALFFVFIIIEAISLEVMHFKFLSASFDEFARSNYNKKISGEVNY